MGDTHGSPAGTSDDDDDDVRSSRTPMPARNFDPRPRSEATIDPRTSASERLVQGRYVSTHNIMTSALRPELGIFRSRTQRCNHQTNAP